MKCRGCEARFTAVQQHVPGDHARLLVSHSRRRSSLSTFCDVPLWFRELRRTCWECKTSGELREGGRREAGVPVLCLQVVGFRHSRSGHLVKLARRFSAERPTKRDKPTRINRYCVLQLNKAIRGSGAFNGRLPVAVGPSDHNNDRYSWWPVCCGNATEAQLTLDWYSGYPLISCRDTLSAVSLILSFNAPCPSFFTRCAQFYFRCIREVMLSPRFSESLTIFLSSVISRKIN